MADNTTEIMLFFFGSAVLLGLEAMKARKWRAYVLWALTGLFITVGALWSVVREWSPTVTKFITSVATNPETWFVLLVLGVILIVLSGHPKIEPPRGVFLPLAENGVPDISTPELARDLRAEMKILRAAITDIQDQIAIDYPNASTVKEAFHNLDIAVHLKVERIHDEVERAKKQINNAHMEFLYLLDFGINVTTRGVLRVFLQEKPSFDKFDPPVEDKARNDLIGEMRIWLQHIRDVVSIAAYGTEIQHALQFSAQDAASLVRQIPPSERPQTIDPIAFHDFFVIAHQSELMAKCLENVIQSLSHNDRSSLERLREFYALRSPKRN